MNVTVTLEYHFARTPDGQVWTATTFAYNFWQRYLQIFDSVSVIARVAAVPAASPHWKRASGPDVFFISVPDYHGPAQYFSCLPQVRALMKRQARQSEAVILRVSSSLGSEFRSHLRPHQPYGVEVVADPYDVFQPGSVVHPLRPLFRYWFTSDLKRRCGAACAAAYVTSHALQARYPCPAYSAACSDVELAPDAFVARPRTNTVTSSGPSHIICVGTMAQMYKGFDVLIRAVGVCVQKAQPLVLSVVGEGHFRPELERLTAELDLTRYVQFLGQLAPGLPIQLALDSADLFVMPSRQEGLPRAMVEAMARALPCLGSNVGGIPELLATENIVPVGDHEALADAMLAVLQNPERMMRMSAENLARAHDFEEHRLLQTRNLFLTRVRDSTADWLHGRTAA